MGAVTRGVDGEEAIRKERRTLAATFHVYEPTCEKRQSKKSGTD
jgi:hypothetical protein